MARAARTWLFSITSLLGYFVSGMASECCRDKSVGGIGYHLLREGDTSNFDCLDNCIYDQENAPGQQFCFKSGELETECKDLTRVRRNLASFDLKKPQDAKEFSDLLHALIAAKKEGSYKGDPISGSQNNNSKDFNSSFNAATSFHGYPGLCEVGDGICCLHGQSLFLPWHRLVIVQLEDSLRSNPTYQHVTLPYWDWTVYFEELPLLIRSPTIEDPLTGTDIENPFYHSLMPGPPVLSSRNPFPYNGSFFGFTKRDGAALVDFTNHSCISSGLCQISSPGDFPTKSVLGDMVLTALEQTNYESFENLIERPHNEFHNQLGFVNLTSTPNCFDDDGLGFCYPYTMRQTVYASYDPIFMIFHAMVDFQWAIFEALQAYRNIPYDCRPSFEKELAPFNSDFNSNSATKSHSRGLDTLDYNKSFGYEYDNLTLFGMTIPVLNKTLEKRNNVDRLFAGISLPNMPIGKITFNICYPSSNCLFSSPNFQISKVGGNPMESAGVYKDSILIYHEVTNYLSQFGLTADQDIAFKIVSTTIPKNVTFTPVSIFRKARQKNERITVHWREDPEEYKYAPSFKVHQGSTPSMRFLLENGTMAVHQYLAYEDFQLCQNKVTENAFEINSEDQYFFQNPVAECKRENKLAVSKSNPCNYPTIVRDEDGNATIVWQVDMSFFKAGICMKPGTRLTFKWDSGDHNVENMTSKADFTKCENFKIDQGHEGPYNITFPPFDQKGFQEEVGVYYIVCPLYNHCNNRMKIKITVTDTCP